MENRRIIVDSQTKTIEVNDKGDTIRLELGNSDFLSKYFKLHKDIADLAERVQTESSKLSINQEDIEQCLEVLEQGQRDAAKLIDDFFGEGTCGKFADGIECPMIDLVVDFINQVSGLIEEFTGERFAAIEKKYANRAARRSAGRR